MYIYIYIISIYYIYIWYMILRYTKHVQSICGFGFLFWTHHERIQALVSIWHAALHEARSGQCFKGKNLSRIVKACKSHDLCFKNPLTNGPGWPGHSYDQLTSLLDPPSSESQISALASQVGCVDVSKEAAPGIRLGYMQWGTQFENATVVAAWREACCLVVSMAAWKIRWQLCRWTYHWKPPGFLKFTSIHHFFSKDAQIHHFPAVISISTAPNLSNLRIACPKISEAEPQPTWERGVFQNMVWTSLNTANCWL